MHHDDTVLFPAQAVIREAACILAAVHPTDESVGNLEIIGADEMLCHKDGSYATPDEGLSLKRWQCCRDCGISNPDDLTLGDAIDWILEQISLDGEEIPSGDLIERLLGS